MEKKTFWAYVYYSDDHKYLSVPHTFISNFNPATVSDFSSTDEVLIKYRAYDGFPKSKPEEASSTEDEDFWKGQVLHMAETESDLQAWIKKTKESRMQRPKVLNYLDSKPSTSTAFLGNNLKQASSQSNREKNKNIKSSKSASNAEIFNKRKESSNQLNQNKNKKPKTSKDERPTESSPKKDIKFDKNYWENRKLEKKISALQTEVKHLKNQVVESNNLILKITNENITLRKQLKALENKEEILIDNAVSKDSTESTKGAETQKLVPDNHIEKVTTTTLTIGEKQASNLGNINKEAGNVIIKSTNVSQLVTGIVGLDDDSSNKELQEEDITEDDPVIKTEPMTDPDADDDSSFTRETHDTPTDEDLYTYNSAEAYTCAPFLEERGSQVHVGYNQWIAAKTWEGLKNVDKTVTTAKKNNIHPEGRFCRDVLLAVVGAEKIKARSMSGKPSNRKIASGEQDGKPKLTPEKFKAVYGIMQRKWLLDGKKKEDIKRNLGKLIKATFTQKSYELSKPPKNKNGNKN